MPLPADPNAAVGVDPAPVAALPPAAWAGIGGKHTYPSALVPTYNYWYVDLPDYGIRIMDISDHVHRKWFSKVHSINRIAHWPRVNYPLKAHRPWSIRNILVHQFAGGLGKKTTDADHFGDHGFHARLQRVCENKGKMRSSVKNTDPVTGVVTTVLLNRYKKSSWGYHFVIPFYADTYGDLILVYKVQNINAASVHSGAHHVASIGIALMGHPRSYQHPTGLPGQPQGRASIEQHKALRGVVRYLQDFYKIQDSQIQGHFTHNEAGRRNCPGYDPERYILDLEDRIIHAHKHDPDRLVKVESEPRFCYPIALTGSSTPGLPRVWERGLDGEIAVYPGALMQGKATAVKYMENARSKSGGAFPYGRRPVWHNGCHLFPDSAGGDVYAVRDGWIIAANLKKEISYQKAGAANTSDFGSASWILIQHHESPAGGVRYPHPTKAGKWIAPKLWKLGHKMRPYPMNYYSLYMHIKPLENAAAADKFAWLKELKRRDSAPLYALHRSVINDDATHAFGWLAIPVQTGDVIAQVGKHAAVPNSPGDTAAPKLIDVLHFEMFSTDNLLKDDRFGPRIDEKWIVKDDTLNPLVLDQYRAKADHFDLIKRPNDFIDFEARREELNDAGPPRHSDHDPKEQRTDHAPQHETAKFQDALSKIVALHASEWAVDYGKIKNTTFKDIWGVTPTDWNDFKDNYVDEMQWLREAWKSPSSTTRDSLQESSMWLKSMKKWQANTMFYYFHPIRMLNWLNGLSRGMIHPLDYYRGEKLRTIGGTLEKKNQLWKVTPQFDWLEELF